MSKLSKDVWRPLFLLSALLLSIGGARHPRDETIEGMLRNPDWVWSHTLVLAGFVGLLMGLVMYARSQSLSERVQKWWHFAVIGTVLQIVEMVFHTASSVDHANLVAERATPILTTHLWLSVTLYPIFALTFIGFIVAATSERRLGSAWIGWLGVVGLLAHGAAPVLVVLFQIMGARILFPMLLLFALWMLLAALWPLRAVATEVGLGLDALEEAPQPAPTG